ncbi:MAG: anaerobic ribonucleoside-triphosphate reductase activating protein [Muribaculaceae bacterium]
MQILDIIDGTSVDGPGLRTSIYFAGCIHHCPGCQNPQSWNPAAGFHCEIDTILTKVIENDFDVTFSGGDPLFQVEQLTLLARKIKQLNKEIWCYTGYQYEDIIASQRLSQILPYIDVLVDSPFIQSLRDISLHFRGSSNQRIIDVKQSLKNGKIILMPV